jgi:hypothetical protein
MRIVEFLPSTGFEQPKRDEAEKLLKVVLASAGKRPELRNAEIEPDEFLRAFVACGYLCRLPAPSRTRSFGGLLDVVNANLTIMWNAPSVTGAAFFAAILAHADIPWRAQDEAIGQMLEIGADPFTGSRCLNTWRDLLGGKANLLAPVPPDPAVRSARERGPTRVYRLDQERWRESAMVKHYGPDERLQSACISGQVCVMIVTLPVAMWKSLLV